MNKYKLIRNNNHTQYIKNKDSKERFKKIKLSCGAIFISITMISLIAQNNILNSVQSIGYNINEIFTDTNDISNLDTKVLKNFEHFENVLKKNIPSEYLNNYYNNITTLKYYNNPNDLNKFLNSNIGAYYNNIDNRIIVCVSDKESYKHALFHELLHMASTNKFDSGFNTEVIGKGINEGYTEYLVQEYFKDDFIAYPGEVRMIKILNYIIGEDKMMKYYFTNDLNSLKIDLCNIFGTEKDANELLSDITLFNKNNDKKILNNITYSLMKYCYSYEINKNNNLELDNTLRIQLYNLYDDKNFNEIEQRVIDELTNNTNKKLLKKYN